MRKILILPAVALAFAACSKENANNGLIGETGTTINFTSGGVDATRTSFDGGQDLAWATGDRIAIIQSTDNTSYEQKVYAANADGRTDGSALFTEENGQPFTVPANSTANYYYWSYYPYTGAAVNYTAGTVPVELTTAQVQVGRTTDHLSAYNILGASMVSDTGAGNTEQTEIYPGDRYLDLDFSIATALIEVRIARAAAATAWSGAQVQAVTLDCVNDRKSIAGAATMVINRTSSAAGFAAITPTGGTGTETVTVTVGQDGQTPNTVPDFTSWPSNAAAADASVFPVYMTIYPGDFSNTTEDHFTLTVQTNIGRRVVSGILAPYIAANEYGFVRGKKYVVNVTLSGTPQ